VEQKADFGPDILLVDNIYVAAPGRDFADTGQVDKPGVKVGVVQNAVPDQFLSRTLKFAELVRVSAPIEVAAEALRSGKADVFASSGQYARAIVAGVPSAKIIPGAFLSVHMAVALPKGRSSVAQSKFAEILNEAKRTGVVQRAIGESADRGSGCAKLIKSSHSYFSRLRRYPVLRTIAAFLKERNELPTEDYFCTGRGLPRCRPCHTSQGETYQRGRCIIVAFPRPRTERHRGAPGSRTGPAPAEYQDRSRRACTSRRLYTAARHVPNAINASMYKQLNSFIRDIARGREHRAHSQRHGGQPVVAGWTVQNSSIAKAVRQINMASAGNSTSQRRQRLFKIMTGIACCTCPTTPAAAPSPPAGAGHVRPDALLD
jgi:hypothetical protein